MRSVKAQLGSFDQLFAPEIASVSAQQLLLLSHYPDCRRSNQPGLQLLHDVLV